MLRQQLMVPASLFLGLGPTVAESRPRWSTFLSERAAIGKATRGRVSLVSHAEFETTRRSDPIELLEGQAVTQVPELVPIRRGRMIATPFSFYRGGALVMATDLARTPNSGLQVQLCGDAHMSNFGIHASPERRLVFDINAFDETRPGPFEWDVNRPAASLAVAGRDNGFSAKKRHKTCRPHPPPTASRWSSSPARATCQSGTPNWT